MQKFKKNISREKTALITGGAGFIGSHMADTLLNNGYTVRILDNFSTGSEKNIRHLYSNTHFSMIRGDIRNTVTLKSALENVDFVFHFAAFVSVPLSIETPQQCFETNVSAFNNLILLLRPRKIPLFYASSAAVYGDREHGVRRESEYPMPTSPYGASKAINEIQAINATKVWGIPAIACRFFNIYGPRQNPSGAYASVIPRFCEKLIKNESPIIYGSGEQTRDFIYVQDVTSILLKLLPLIAVNTNLILNIGTGSSLTVNTIFETLKKITGTAIEPQWGKDRAGDIKHSNADITALQNLIGSYNYTAIKKGLIETYDWYVKNIQP